MVENRILYGFYGYLKVVRQEFTKNSLAIHANNNSPPIKDCHLVEERIIDSNTKKIGEFLIEKRKEKEYSLLTASYLAQL